MLCLLLSLISMCLLDGTNDDDITDGLFFFLLVTIIFFLHVHRVSVSQALPLSMNEFQFNLILVGKFHSSYTLICRMELEKKNEIIRADFSKFILSTEPKASEMFVYVLMARFIVQFHLQFGSIAYIWICSRTGWSGFNGFTKIKKKQNLDIAENVILWHKQIKNEMCFASYISLKIN